MEHSVMVVAEGPTCVFQKSSAMNLKNGSTTDKRKSIRSSRAPSSRPTLSHTRRKLVSEDVTVPYQCAVRCRTHGLFVLVPREGRGDALECVAYFLYVHVVENVKARSVPGLHNGVIRTREVGPKTGKSPTSSTYTQRSAPPVSSGGLRDSDCHCCALANST